MNNWFLRTVPWFLLTATTIFPQHSPAAAEPTNPASSAVNLLRRHIETVGGHGAVEKVDSIAYKGIGVEGTKEFEMEVLIRKPDQAVFIISVSDEFQIKMGVAGDGKGWRKEGEMLREFEGGMARDFYGFLLGLNLPALSGLEKGARLEEINQETAAEGKEAGPAMKATTPFGATYQLRFSPEDGLLARINESVISDYRVVEGIKLPFRIQEKGGLSLVIKEARINPDLPASAFEKPQGISMPAGSGYLTNLSPAGQLTIARRPAPAPFGTRKPKKLPAFSANSARPFQVDLRFSDCTALDFAGRLVDLLHADFDDRTRWPAVLPDGFEPATIALLGKNPGLGVRELHRQGITGKGVGVAIIDQPLLVEHAEYGERLRLYEEIHVLARESFAMMHGPAVASIAVGKNVGVAPEADLYYIAETHGEISSEGKFEWDFNYLARSIERLLEINATLPKEKKIRVISISVGWEPSQKGYDRVCAAEARAFKEGVAVISTSIEQTRKLAFHGLGRSCMADPDKVDSWEPGHWWAKEFPNGRWARINHRLLVPMDCRTTASPTGAEEYVYYYSGGWSWSVPWIAGLYALACQVQPEITLETFWKHAVETGRTIRLTRDGKEVDFGPMADPAALIAKLKEARPVANR